jgi:hypothetical protein
MPYVASIGTCLPCWGSPHHRVPGDDEDAITLAVEAGRAGLVSSGPFAVDGARIALAHNIGGPTAVLAVTFLEGLSNGAG